MSHDGAFVSRVRSRLAIAVLALLIGTPDAAVARGIWISDEELALLPAAGPAWDRLKAEADKPAGDPNLSDMNQDHNVYVLAKALAYASTGEEKYRAEVIDQCMKAIGTETGGKTLALGRELAAYVIAADLVGLPAEQDERFRFWLRATLTETLDGKTLVSTHEKRPNNWGTHAGASRAAVAAYLGDKRELDRTAQVFRTWLGDRSATFNGFKFGKNLTWQCDPSRPLGINPKGCRRDGHSLDGVLPDDQRRAGEFTWPPPKENYVYGALQGALVQAVILHHAGYDAFEWGDRALLRAFQWLHTEAHFIPVEDDTWMLPLVDHVYGTRFWDGGAVTFGKNMGWTDWMYPKK